MKDITISKPQLEEAAERAVKDLDHWLNDRTDGELSLFAHDHQIQECKNIIINHITALCLPPSSES